MEKDRRAKEAPQGSVLLQRVLLQSRRQKYQRTRKLPCRISEMLQYCVCKPPPGMKKSHLTALCRRFAKTTLSSVQDTTDVSTFQTLMAKRCETVPLRVLLAYAHTHVVFNQDHLLRSFIEKKAFLFKPPWFDWQLLQSIVKKSKQTGQRCRLDFLTMLCSSCQSHRTSTSAKEQRCC